MYLNHGFLKYSEGLQLGREVIHSYYLQSSNQAKFWQSMFGGNVCSLIVFAIIICSASSPASPFFGVVAVLVLFTIYDLVSLGQPFHYSFDLSCKLEATHESFSFRFSCILKDQYSSSDFGRNSFLFLAGIFTGIQQAVALLEILNQAL